MALKSKRPSAGASQDGKKTAPPFSDKMLHAGAPATKKAANPRRTGEVETIEARLARKAAVADSMTLATTSLGQMTREKRHKLLYGD